LPRSQEFWLGSHLVLPPNAPQSWMNILTGGTVIASQLQKAKRLSLRDVFKNLPVAVLRGVGTSVWKTNARAWRVKSASNKATLALWFRGRESQNCGVRAVVDKSDAGTQLVSVVEDVLNNNDFRVFVKSRYWRHIVLVKFISFISAKKFACAKRSFTVHFAALSICLHHNLSLSVKAFSVFEFKKNLDTKSVAFLEFLCASNYDCRWPWINALRAAESARTSTGSGYLRWSRERERSDFESDRTASRPDCPGLQTANFRRD
jgi:hypothetical protein